MSARPPPLGRLDSGFYRRGSCPRTRQWARASHARGYRPRVRQTQRPRPKERCQRADETEARSFEILEAIAHRPERWLVMLAVDGDVAGGVFDRGRGLGQRHDWAPLEQPNQARAVVTAQPPVGRVRPLRQWRQTEQVRRLPPERFGLCAPLGEEALGGLNCLLPALDRDMVGTTSFERREGATKATEATKGGSFVAFVALVATALGFDGVEAGQILTHWTAPEPQTRSRPGGRPCFCFRVWRAPSSPTALVLRRCGQQTGGARTGREYASASCPLVRRAGEHAQSRRQPGRRGDRQR